MLRTYPRIIQSGRDRIYRCDLSVLILTEIRLHPMEYAFCTGCHGCCRSVRVHTETCRLAADQLNTFILDKLIKHSHGIAATADARHNHIWKPSFLLQYLCSRLPADHTLKIPDDHWERVRSHNRSKYIKSIIYTTGPLTHTFVDRIL